MYFSFFVYLINNVNTRLEMRTVVWAVFVGFIISVGTVVAFFQLGYGTERSIFSSLKDEPSKSVGFKPGKNFDQALTLDNARGLGKEGRVSESAIKRSQGMFRHPSIPASICGLILPIVLAYLVAARRSRDRILLLIVFILGVAGLVLTFSRAGAVGLAFGICAFFVLAGWSGLISRRMLAVSIVGLILVTAVSIPAMGIYFGARPESFSMRFNLFQAALQAYSQRPILGVGLNNSTGEMKAAKQEMRDTGIRVPLSEAAENLYLVLLTEVGPVGFILFFLFLWKIVMTALRAMCEAPIDLKPLLVGIVAGLASLATQNLADDTLAGHAVSATLWLFVSLIVAVARYIQAETRSYPAGANAAAHSSAIATRPLTYNR
jgi:O-antigen ligase